MKNHAKNIAKILTTELKKIKVTIMLLMVVAIFIICWLVQIINDYINFHFIPYAENNFVTLYFTTINFSVNCVIYGIYLKRFRQVFLNTFNICLKQKNGKERRREPIELSVTTATITRTISSN